MTVRTPKRKYLIDVKQTGHDDPLTFEVSVREGATETRHDVTLSLAQLARLTNAPCPSQRCIQAIFQFLLEREPKEAILGRFDVSIIPHYFPEFESTLRQYIEE